MWCRRAVLRPSVCSASHRRCHVVVRDFQDIPCPPGWFFPYVGQGPLLIKQPHGATKFWKNVQELKDKYVNPDVNLLRLHVPLMNKAGQGRVVLLFDPRDVEEVYRNEGKYPTKGPFAIWPLKIMRDSIPHLFEESRGLFFEDGQRWHGFRSKVQQDLMRPQSALFYTEELQDVADSLVGYIRSHRNQDGVYPTDFMFLSYLYSLESISLITLDTRLYSLSGNISAEVKDFIDSFGVAMSSVPKLFASKNLFWQLLPLHWNPLFRQGQDAMVKVHNFVGQKVNDYRERLEKQEQKTKKYVKDTPLETSVLEKLILRNEPTSTLPLVMAIDLLLFGVDTTGSTLGFFLYHLAKNPEKQAALREEILSFRSDNLTVEDVVRMKYFRACLQESLRLTSTISFLARQLDKDIRLRGFKVPAQTLFIWTWSVIGKDERLFKKVGEFVPERWMNPHEKPHPFAVRQFSHGPRICIGKRFAELEVQMAAVKLLQNFHIEWVADYDVETVARLVNIPDRPLLFKFTDISRKT